MKVFPQGLMWGVIALITMTARAAEAVRWKKIVVDAKFRSEGVAVADVNRDGLKDVLVGGLWYEAPAWKAHQIGPPRDYGDGAHSYSDYFICFADDINGDGWVDLMSTGLPGTPFYWYKNPRNAGGHWRRHLIWKSACNETPVRADLFGDGRKVLIMASEPEGQMFWFAPGPDPAQPWRAHAISKASTAASVAPGTNRFSHGLGAGDINHDGRADVLVKEGWWEQPPDAKTSLVPWTFHRANLGEDCANMHVADVNGDGLADVLSSSAHGKGIWLHRADKSPGGFARRPILNLFSQTHALNFADINGDGRRDLIAGKRWWGYGPTGDIEPNAPALLMWIEIKPKTGAAPGTLPDFIPHQIDDNSGAGTQFSVEDVSGDGWPDVIVSNKKGVHIFEQVRPAAR